MVPRLEAGGATHREGEKDSKTWFTQQNELRITNWYNMMLQERLP
ncbi:hypothetical protein COO91_07980 [Nostoc flagelliforme CCNUN1]|uniref:Uncharacterized protein n=1 Tax=Nostoc flagelliforme CCNUN1 TaxID=2038116 RepID=A0A2K8T2G9_9NOSO|nr:hypothetical protein COO91_07980 [Nostoc flagelliforme CCNUN1]